MSDFLGQIKSIGQTMGVEYTRPDRTKVGEYQKALSPEAIAYLKGRGFTKDTVLHFRLGYRADYDAISIPVYKRGELVNIKYRLLNPTTVKYMGESGAESWMFNDDGVIEGKKEKSVLIVEGEFDAMMCWQKGIKAVVSPAAGAQSYGVWLEQIDDIKKIYIAYDNDKAGKDAGREIAKRLGEEKAFIMEYPKGIKDANEFFEENELEDFIKLKKKAKPLIREDFKTLGDVIQNMRNSTTVRYITKFIPEVSMRPGWLGILSGRSNAGKTSIVLNMAKDFTEQNVPVLIMPFERGIDAVGERYLQVMAGMTEDGFEAFDDEGWEQLIDKTSKQELYFTVPNKDDIAKMISKAARFLNTKVVVIDHLDYAVRNIRGSREEAIANTLQELKAVAEKHGVVLIIVTHIRKVDGAGTMAQVKRPGIEDLKGSSALYQDPEFVVMLSQTDNDGEILVDVIKNKGPMEDKVYGFAPATGVFNANYVSMFRDMSEEDNNLWNDFE